MDNVKITTKGRKIVLEIDMDGDFGPSSSGKTVVVASTRGNVPVGMSKDGQPISIGVNCFRKP